MELSHSVDYITKEADKRHLKIGIYASSEDYPHLKIEINPDEVFSIASIFKMNILVEAARRIAGGSLQTTDRITLRFHHKCPGSVPGKLDEGTELTINNLLQFMMEMSDNTCSDMLGEYLGWENITAAMPLWGITKTEWLMPAKLQMAMGCNLVPELKEKSLSEKREIWESMSSGEKMKMILRNYDYIKETETEEINRCWNEYFNKLNWINQKEIPGIFGWKGTAGEYGRLTEKIARGTLISPEISSIAKKYMITDRRGIAASAIPSGCILGRKGGSDEGVRCEVVFIESPESDRITIAIFTQELTYLPDLSDIMEDFISDTGRAIYTYYTSLKEREMKFRTLPLPLSSQPLP